MDPTAAPLGIPRAPDLVVSPLLERFPDLGPWLDLLRQLLQYPAVGLLLLCLFFLLTDQGTDPQKSDRLLALLCGLGVLVAINAIFGLGIPNIPEFGPPVDPGLFPDVKLPELPEIPLPEMPAGEGAPSPSPSGVPGTEIAR